MKDLIDDVFVSAFDNPSLAPLEDQARFDLAELAAARRPPGVHHRLFRRRSAVLSRRRHRQARRLRHGQRSRGRRRDSALSVLRRHHRGRRAARTRCGASRARWPRRPVTAGVHDRHRRHQGGATRRLRQAVHHHDRHRRDPRGGQSGRDRPAPGDAVLVNGVSAITARPSSRAGRHGLDRRRSTATARRCTD